MTSNICKSAFLAILTAAAVVSCAKEKELSSLGSASSSNATSQRPDVPISQDEIDKAIYIQGSVIVTFDDDRIKAIEGGSFDPSKEFASELGFTGMERLFPEAGEYEKRTREAGLHRFYVVNFDTDVPLSKAQRLLCDMNGVENFEKRNIMTLGATNDPKWSSLWEFTSSKYKINVESAWAYSTGDPNVVVCVVDEGIQLDHSDLAWNCGETHYNFVKKNNTIVAGSHGSHVAGSIAAVGNNGVGIVGIAGGDYAKGQRGVTLLSAQVFQGNSSAASFQSAIKWGADNGAIISQNSWGNNYDFDGDGVLSESEKNYALNDKISSSMAAAIDYFRKNAGCDASGNQKAGSPMKGGVVCFAAGNDGLINGVPSNYDPNIAVGATTASGSLASYSNYGDWVDICAPGSNIYSTVPTSSYSTMSGTSMACPHISGACALLASIFGGDGFTNEMLEDILLSGAKRGLINSGSKAMGPYLDLKGSVEYGLEKYNRGGNRAPVIAPGVLTGDLSYNRREKVSNTFSVSDEDGDEITVTYEVGGPATIAAVSGQKNTYRFSLDCATVEESFVGKKYTVKITATDTKDGKAVHSFTYTIVKNNPPVISASTLSGRVMFRQGADASKLFSVSDQDGDKVTLTYNIEGPALIREKSATSYEFYVAGAGITDPALLNKDFNVTLTATDSEGDSSEHKFEYYIKTNSAPSISTAYDGNFAFRQWEYVSIPFTISDADNDPVTVTFTNTPADGKGVYNTSTNCFTLACENVKDFGVKKAEITATDNYGGKTAYSFDYKVIETLAPVVKNEIGEYVLPGVDIRKELALSDIFEDPNGDALRYTVEAGVGVTTNVNGDLLTLMCRNVGAAQVKITAEKKDVPGKFEGKASLTFTVICRDSSVDFDYYPNPVKDYLYIRPASETALPVDVRISSVSGLKVFEGTLPSCSLNAPGKVDMSACAAGQYKLHVKIADKEYDKVIVKVAR